MYIYQAACSLTYELNLPGAILYLYDFSPGKSSLDKHYLNTPPQHDPKHTSIFLSSQSLPKSSHQAISMYKKREHVCVC